MSIGFVGIVVCIVGFAISGFLGARHDVHGGWIVASFFGCVSFGILGGYGARMRHRATQETQEAEQRDEPSDGP